MAYVLSLCQLSLNLKYQILVVLSHLTNHLLVSGLMTVQLLLQLIDSNECIVSLLYQF